MKEKESIRIAFSCSDNTKKFLLKSVGCLGKKHVSGIHLQEGKNWFLVDDRISAITTLPNNENE